VTGVKTESGSTFHAHKVILCTGAWTNSLLDTKGQLIPKGHCIGHIQLTPEEHERYSSIPIVDNEMWNVYYFPPFPENGIMKLAAVGSGYRAKQGPRMQSDHPNDGIPREAEEHLRRGIKQSIPAFENKEMFDVRVCWDMDTADEDFLITPHPDIGGVFIATGGYTPLLYLLLISGSHHGFKFLPRIGHYIALMIEGKLPSEFSDCWKWRPGLEWKTDVEREGVLLGKNFEELDGWEGSAHHGVMSHTWGN